MGTSTDHTGCEQMVEQPEDMRSGKGSPFFPARELPPSRLAALGTTSFARSTYLRLSFSGPPLSSFGPAADRERVVSPETSPSLFGPKGYGDYRIVETAATILEEALESARLILRAFRWSVARHRKVEVRVSKEAR
ncbi:hypothetical protein KM043_007203 [Ampulex compressa]|nr:hypothetical protein KM043_007203 [Ampulex compressa]